MRRPIPYHMWNETLPAMVEGRVIDDALAYCRGVEVMEVIW